METIGWQSRLRNRISNIMTLTYQDLLEKLYEMSPEERMKPVQLRDYGTEETHDAEDFVSSQIGFNGAEEIG